MRAKIVDDFIAQYPAEQQTMLEVLRRFIETIVPQAEETISYQIPTFKLYGPLVGFGPIKGGCSFYACSGSTLEDYSQELKGLKHSKSAINFSLDQELPFSLMERIIKQRVLENEEKERLRKKKKTKSLP